MKEKPELCPICRAKISPDDVLQGRCPECGQNLPGASHAGKQWEGYGAPGAAHDRASVGRGFGAGGGMSPPPPQGAGYGDGAYQGAAAATPEGPPRKNVFGLIAVICGLVAVMGMATLGYSRARLLQIFTEITENLEGPSEPWSEEREEPESWEADGPFDSNHADDVSRSERDKAGPQAQEPKGMDLHTAVLLSEVSAPFAFAGIVGAIALGIVGLCRRGRKKGMALLGLLLGIASPPLGELTSLILRA